MLNSVLTATTNLLRIFCEDHNPQLLLAEIWGQGGGYLAFGTFMISTPIMVIGGNLEFGMG